MCTSRERAAHAFKIVPPIVIAEDRPGAERRFEPRQFGRPDPHRRPARLELVPGLEIAEQHDEVGAQRVGRIDDVADVRQRHIGTAGMQVGDHRDGELAAGRPARRRQRIGRDNEAERLDRAGIGGGRGRRQSGESSARGEKTTPRQARLRRAAAAAVRWCCSMSVPPPSDSSRVMNGVFIRASQLRP